MNFTQLLKTIQESQVFQNFKQQHPEAELVAGFFILDFMSNDNKKTLDYKTENNIFTFSLNKNNEITIQEDKLLEFQDKPNLPKLTPLTNTDIKIEVDELKGIAGIQTLDNGIQAKFHKIIAVLQNHSGYETNHKPALVWNLTCMLEQLIILHILIDANSGKVLKFERKSMMDFVKKKG